MMKIKSKIISLIQRSLVLAALLMLVGFSYASPKNSTSDDLFHLTDNHLVLEVDSGRLIYQALPGNAMEVRYQAKATTEFPSFAKKENISLNKLIVSQNKQQIILLNGSLKAVINKQDFSTQFYQNGRLLTQQTAFWFKAGSLGFAFSLDNKEIIMGGGERVIGMNRRGYRLPLYNRAHYGYTDHAEQMYYSLPYIMSSKGYSILFDNSARGWLDIGKTQADSLQFEAVGGRAAYIIFAADSYPQLMNNYTQVTGRQPLPALWTLGNFASRFGYRDQKQVRSTVKQFIEKDIPLDAVVLDLYWFGSEIKGLMGRLDWDRQQFPEPEKMITDLEKNNIKTILVTEPFILSSSDRWQQAVEQSVLAKDVNHQSVKRFDFYFGNTGIIDIFDNKAKKWFSGIYDKLDQQGATGVWGDLGEPEVHPDDTQHYLSSIDQYISGEILHNVYGHEWAKLVYQNQLKNHPNERPFVMMRSGFAGSQRYGIIPWTGDVSRSWEGLRSQIELSLTMGLSGLAYTHSDLGGFAGGEAFNKELYIRWLQYGVFQPIYRPHGQDHIAPEPVFHDAETLKLARQSIKLRYQLLPYLYTLAYQNTTTGMPLMRPMFFEQPNNIKLYNMTQSYLWGDALLISPITKANEVKHQFYLPAGNWFDFWSDKKYQGNQTIELPVSLKQIPVMVRAGSFIPMIEPINNTKNYSTESMSIHYYHDQSVIKARYSLFNDDGQSLDSLVSGQYELLYFVSEFKQQQLSFNLSRDAKNKVEFLKQRHLQFVIHHWPQRPKKIMFSAKVLDKRQYSYDAEQNKLIINIKWDHKNRRLKIIN